jgi:release factor glutamine methyltransferase
LIFYEAIAGFAKTNLLPGGSIFVEIQEESGNAVQELFSKNGFSQITIRKDMQGKDRLLRATME